MTATATLLTDFRPIGGALCLDFANTVDWHDTDHPVELLADAGCLAAWARVVGLSGPAGEEPPYGPDDLPRVRELRDAVWEAFRAATHSTPSSATAVAVLNRNLALVPAHRRLAVSDAGVAWVERPDPGIDGLLGRVASSAAALLTDPARLARVRMCAAEGCGWLFLDESRGARRRWCSMRGCGNRAKARAHYRRKAEAGAG